MIKNWNAIREEFNKSPNEILVAGKKYSEECKTTLDVVVNNALLITVNKYLRILCSGDSEYANIFKFNNKFKNIIGENKYAVAHDVFGGIFALTQGGIHYFSPDTLQWEDLGISYEGLIEWFSLKDISDFYESFMWDDFDKIIDDIRVDEGILMYPFLWARACDPQTASKKIVPFHELLQINHEINVTI